MPLDALSNGKNKLHSMIRAIFFDCNGVIADDEPIHMKLFQKVLQEENILLTEKDYFEKYLAMDDRSCFTEALKNEKKAHSPKKVQTLIQRKAQYYQKIIQNELKIFPGVTTFVQQHQTQYIMAVVSGALRNEINLILKTANILSAFSTIISAEDVQNGKPNPEGYLLAYHQIKKLNTFREHPLLKHECVAIEDSIHGVDSAQTAGMKCIAITNSYSKNELKHADLIVSSLEKLNLNTITL